MNSQLIVPVVEQSQPNSRLIGYARVLTDDQDLSLQIDALTKQGIPANSSLWTKSRAQKPNGQD